MIFVSAATVTLGSNDFSPRNSQKERFMFMGSLLIKPRSQTPISRLSWTARAMSQRQTRKPADQCRPRRALQCLYNPARFVRRIPGSAGGNLFRALVGTRHRDQAPVSEPAWITRWSTLLLRMLRRLQNGALRIYPQRPNGRWPRAVARVHCPMHGDTTSDHKGAIWQISGMAGFPGKTPKQTGSPGRRRLVPFPPRLWS